MENYCRGILFGMLAGICVGAVVVAKNKKLSKKINDGLDVAVQKVEDIKESLEDKTSENNGEFCTSSGECFSFGSSDLNEEKDKKNFYKKPKNK